MNQRTRIKICGITTLDAAQAAVQSGADALGFVFYAKSPRAIDAQQAQSIIEKSPAFISFVGLFVNADAEEIRSVLAVTQLSILQFHGDESPEFCEQFNKPYIKALRMRDNLDLEQEIKRYNKASAILLDTYDPSLVGGTGKAFDWERIPSHLRGEIVLAGGLTPENIEQAVLQIQPFAVDVSGGVESSKAKKSQEKIHAFIHQVQLADRQK